ncbi:FAD-dependent monooxygenase [Nocardia blacklockiae]|uniref:FAD-dependent monooxygenase n=1 Tax=Nocardia blacklockiae TaxID=480036 RepID=UPI001895DFE3|nr:FAD-dependent monooxygenase [Nocardia blacklockiae]MBF6169852.1 FAD-dependent monooxygenase [Nocardia blacklockiae]
MTAATNSPGTTTEFDCVILGSGVGGALLALLLGRRGQRVLLLEAGSRPPTRGAEILKARGIRVLAEHGLLAELLNRGALERVRIDIYHDGALLLSYDFAEYTRLGLFLIVPYSRIVSVVLDACAELPNVDLRFGRRLLALCSEQFPVSSAMLDDGTSIRARTFVDAAGSLSALGTFVESARDVTRQGQVLRMATVPVTASVLSRNRLYFGSGGGLAYFYPIDNRTARVFVGFPREQDARIFDEHRDDLRARLADFVTDTDDAVALLRADRFARVPIAVYTSKPYHRENVILLGSAAFSPHPMTGQGMSYTLEDATVLAEILTEATDAHRLELLLQERYEPRRALHARLVAYGDALAASYHDRAAYLRAHDPVLHGGDR